MRSFAAVLVSLLAAGGCNGEEENGLSGSVAGDYNLDFDVVLVQKQYTAGKLDAVYVKYAKKLKEDADCTKAGACSLPVKITIGVTSSTPVEAGREIELQEGSLIRVMPDSSQFDSFSTSKKSKIYFDELGEPGESARGSFWIIFASGKNLNGEFSATVEKISI